MTFEQLTKLKTVLDAAMAITETDQRLITTQLINHAHTQHKAMVMLLGEKYNEAMAAAEAGEQPAEEQPAEPVKAKE